MAKVAAMAAPMHLGIKGLWTEEMQSDWTGFRAKQQRDAVDLIMRFMSSRVFILLLMWRVFLDYMALGFSLPRLLFGSPSTCMALFLILAYIAGQSVGQSVYKLDVGFAAAMQMVLLVVLQSVNLLTACSMETELMQHRYYLTSQIVIYGLLWTAIYVPLWAHLFIGMPINFTCWLIFHRVVGFWQSQGFVKAATFGALLCVLVPIIFTVKERVLWVQFRALCQMDREREVLEATQAALRCMLSTLWDASCICDENGAISSSTPQLARLFGCDLVGKCLLDFAASDDDGERLQKVLKNTASAASEKAHTLQFTAKSRWLGLDYEGLTCRSAHYEVALYGIKLPPGAASDDSLDRKDGKNLFIGIKASARNEDTQLRSFTEPKRLLDDSVAQSTTAAESTADVTDAASLLHGCTSVFSFDYAASSQTIFTKDAIRQHEASTQTEAHEEGCAHLNPKQSFEGAATEDDLEKLAPRPSPVRLSLDALCPADESKASVTPAARDSRPIKLEFAEVTALRSSARLFVPLTSSHDVGDVFEKDCLNEESISQQLEEELHGSEDESPMFGPVVLTLDSLCPSEPTALSSAALPFSGNSTDPTLFQQTYNPKEGSSVPVKAEVSEASSNAAASWQRCSAYEYQQPPEELSLEAGATPLEHPFPGCTAGVSQEEAPSKQCCADENVMSDLLDEVEQYVFGSDTSSEDGFSPKHESTPTPSPEPLHLGFGSSDPAHKQELTPDEDDSAPPPLEASHEMPNPTLAAETAHESEAAASNSGPISLSLEALLCPAVEGEHSSKDKYAASSNTDAWQSWPCAPGCLTTSLSNSSGLVLGEHHVGPDVERLHLVARRKATSSTAHDLGESEGQGSQLSNVHFVNATQLWLGPRSASASSLATSGSSSDEALSRRAHIRTPADGESMAYMPGHLLRQEASRHEADSRSQPPQLPRSERAAWHERNKPQRQSSVDSSGSSSASWSSSSASDNFVPLQNNR